MKRFTIYEFAKLFFPATTVLALIMLLIYYGGIILEDPMFLEIAEVWAFPFLVVIILTAMTLIYIAVNECGNSFMIKNCEVKDGK